MDERMTQVLGNLRAAVGPDKWDAFFEAMYDAFGNHDELDGENAVLFEQVQVLKRENNELKMKFIAANRKSIDLEHEVADLKAEYEGCIELPKDADGEYVRIGDVMECVYNGEKRQFPVSYLKMESDGWHVYLAVSDYVRHGYKPSELLHCRPDTWERIINESYMRGVRAQQEAQMESRKRGADAFVSSVEIPDDYDLVIRCKELCERTMSGDAE